MKRYAYTDDMGLGGRSTNICEASPQKERGRDEADDAKFREKRKTSGDHARWSGSTRGVLGEYARGPKSGLISSKQFDPPTTTVSGSRHWAGSTEEDLIKPGPIYLSDS